MDMTRDDIAIELDTGFNYYTHNDMIDVVRGLDKRIEEIEEIHLLEISLLHKALRVSIEPEETKAERLLATSYKLRRISDNLTQLPIYNVRVSKENLVRIKVVTLNSILELLDLTI